MIPAGYEVVETWDRVDDKVELRTRFLGRAQKRAARLNEGRVFPSYRYEAVREDGRWVVAAFQNVLRKIEGGRTEDVIPGFKISVERDSAP